MRRIAIIALLLCVALAGIKGQETKYSLKKGNSLLSEHIGYAQVAVALSYEYCITDLIFKRSSSLGLGIYVVYYPIEFQNVVGGARLTQHNQIGEKTDLVLGLTAGMKLYKPYINGERNYFSPNIALFIGARYAFTEYLNVGLEVAPTLFIPYESFLMGMSLVSVVVSQRF